VPDGFHARLLMPASSTAIQIFPMRLFTDCFWDADAQPWERKQQDSPLFARVPSVEPLHALTHLVHAIPFRPRGWRDPVIAAVERDPLRQIRKGEIVIE
jgi:hypothetical protein